MDEKTPLVPGGTFGVLETDSNHAPISQQPPCSKTEFWSSSSSIRKSVLISPHSNKEIITRHQLLLAGNIGTAVFLIRDAVLGDFVEDPAAGAYDPFSASNAEQVIRNELSIQCRRIYVAAGHCYVSYILRLDFWYH
jgi:hypothetical protein